MVIGIIVALALVASLRLPGLKEAISPPLLLVPSGKIISEYPSLIMLAPSLMVLSDSLVSALIMNKLLILRIHFENTGILASSSLAMNPT